MRHSYKLLRICFFLLGLVIIAAVAPEVVYADGMETCPGRFLTIPAVGFDTVDAGSTHNKRNDCAQCSSGDIGGPGRDVFYYFDITTPTRLRLTTCNSQFDTYMCIYKDSCCGEGRVPVFVNDDSPLCAPHSERAAIDGCFRQSGRYYLVLTGHDAGAYGAFEIRIRNLGNAECGEILPVCTPGYATHLEGIDEAVCEHEFTTMETCPAGFCGTIGRRGDRDVYSFVLNECKNVTLSCFADSTPGRSGYHGGLNPRLRLFEGPACDHPLYENDDFNGIGTDPHGTDSRIVAECLRPGTYWVEISSDTTGKYEFLYECSPCLRQPQGNYGSGQHQDGNRYCFQWQAIGGADVYYVWRLFGQLTWQLAGTTRETTFCETLIGSEGAPFYAAFADPCGQPNLPDKR